MEVIHSYIYFTCFVGISFCEESIQNVTDLDVMMCAKPSEGLGNLTINVGEALVFTIPDEAFTLKVNIMQITSEGGSLLPDWLDFNVTSQVLHGSPELMDEGIYQLDFLLQCADCESTCHNFTETMFISVLIQKPGKAEHSTRMRSACLSKLNTLLSTDFLSPSIHTKLFVSSMLPRHDCTRHERVIDLAIVLNFNDVPSNNDQLHLLMIFAEIFQTDCSRFVVIPFSVLNIVYKTVNWSVLNHQLRGSDQSNLSVNKYVIIVHVSCDYLPKLHGIRNEQYRKFVRLLHQSVEIGQLVYTERPFLLSRRKREITMDSVKTASHSKDHVVDTTETIHSTNSPLSLFSAELFIPTKFVTSISSSPTELFSKNTKPTSPMQSQLETSKLDLPFTMPIYEHTSDFNELTLNVKPTMTESVEILSKPLMNLVDSLYQSEIQTSVDLGQETGLSPTPSAFPVTDSVLLEPTPLFTTPTSSYSSVESLPSSQTLSTTELEASNSYFINSHKFQTNFQKQDLESSSYSKSSYTSQFVHSSTAPLIDLPISHFTDISSSVLVSSLSQIIKPSSQPLISVYKSSSDVSNSVQPTFGESEFSNVLDSTPFILTLESPSTNLMEAYILYSSLAKPDTVLNVKFTGSLTESISTKPPNFLSTKTQDSHITDSSILTSIPDISEPFPSSIPDAFSSYTQESFSSKFAHSFSTNIPESISTKILDSVLTNIKNTVSTSFPHSFSTTNLEYFSSNFPDLVSTHILDSFSTNIQESFPSKFPDSFSTFSPDSFTTDILDYFARNIPASASPNIPELFATNIFDSFTTNFQESLSLNFPDSFLASIQESFSTNIPDFLSTNLPQSFSNTFQTSISDSYATYIQESFSTNIPDLFSTKIPDLFLTRIPHSSDVSDSVSTYIPDFYTINSLDSFATKNPYSVSTNIPDFLSTRIPDSKTIPYSFLTNIPQSVLTNIPDLFATSVSDYSSINIPDSLSTHIQESFSINIHVSISSIIDSVTFTTNSPDFFSTNSLDPLSTNIPAYVSTNILLSSLTNINDTISTKSLESVSSNFSNSISSTEIISSPAALLQTAATELLESTPTLIDRSYRTSLIFSPIPTSSSTIQPSTAQFSKIPDTTASLLSVITPISAAISPTSSSLISPTLTLISPTSSLISSTLISSTLISQTSLISPTSSLVSSLISPTSALISPTSALILSTSSLLSPTLSLTPPTSALISSSALISLKSALISPTSSLISPTSSLISPTSSLISPTSSLISPISSLIAPALISPTSSLISLAGKTDIFSRTSMASTAKVFSTSSVSGTTKPILSTTDTLSSDRYHLLPSFLPESTIVVISSSQMISESKTQLTPVSPLISKTAPTDVYSLPLDVDPGDILPSSPTSFTSKVTSIFPTESIILPETSSPSEKFEWTTDLKTTDLRGTELFPSSFLSMGITTETFSSPTISSIIEISMSAYTTEPADMFSTTESMLPNESPTLVKPIKGLSLNLGQYFEFLIPAHTFADSEDGSTRNLSLSLSVMPGKNLPANYWIQLNTKLQTIYGFPLAKDFQAHPIKIVLVAKDKGGKSAMDTIMVTLDPIPLKDFSHNFLVTIDMAKDMFMSSLDNLVMFADKLGHYFGDMSSQSVSVLTISKGSVIISWSNKTLSKTVCRMDMIKSLFYKLSARNGGVNDHFFRCLLPEFYVSQVSFRYRGVCAPDVTDAMPGKTTKVPMAQKSEWTDVILPAMIIIFSSLLVIVVAVICIRHFRHRGKSVLRSEKPEYSDFRDPVILPEELELQELEGKPGHPLVLTSDSGIDNPRLSRTSWEDNRPPPPDYQPSGLKSQPMDFSTPNQPGYDNGAYNQTPPGYRLPPTYSTPAHISEA